MGKWADQKTSSNDFFNLAEHCQELRLDAKDSRVRLIGDGEYLTTAGVYWFKAWSEKKGGPVQIKHYATQYDPETGRNGEGCPIGQLAAQYGIRMTTEWWTLAIDRDAEEAKPQRCPAPNASEKSTGFKDFKSRSWTPVHVLTLGMGPVSRLKSLSETNLVTITTKRGEKIKQQFDVDHPKYGFDLVMAYNKAEKVPTNKMKVERDTSTEDRWTPLDAEQQEYLLWDINALLDMAVKASESADLTWLSENIIPPDDKKEAGGRRSRRTDDDDDDMPPARRGNRTRSRVSDDDEDVPVRRGRAALDDEDDEVAPSKRGSARGGRAALDDDDDDGIAEKPKSRSKKPAIAVDDDDDEPPVQKTRGSRKPAPVDDDPPFDSDDEEGDDDIDLAAFDDEDEDEDLPAAPPPRQRGKPVADDLEDDEEVVPAPKSRKAKPAPVLEDDDLEDDLEAALGDDLEAALGDDLPDFDAEEDEPKPSAKRGAAAKVPAAAKRPAPARSTPASKPARRR